MLTFTIVPTLLCYLLGHRTKSQEILSARLPPQPGVHMSPPVTGVCTRRGRWPKQLPRFFPATESFAASRQPPVRHLLLCSGPLRPLGQLPKPSCIPDFLEVRSFLPGLCFPSPSNECVHLTLYSKCIVPPRGTSGFLRRFQ